MSDSSTHPRRQSVHELAARISKGVRPHPYRRPSTSTNNNNTIEKAKTKIPPVVPPRPPRRPSSLSHSDNDKQNVLIQNDRVEHNTVPKEDNDTQNTTTTTTTETTGIDKSIDVVVAEVNAGAETKVVKEPLDLKESEGGDNDSIMKSNNNDESGLHGYLLAASAKRHVALKARNRRRLPKRITYSSHQ